MRKATWLILLFFFNIPISTGQTKVALKGIVTDSIGIPLAYANIIADPEENIALAFSITDGNGAYKLVLEKEKSYRITASYLGYQSQSLNFSLKTDLIQNFELAENSESLDEVSISYIPPIIVKKDSILYRTDAFTTGEERKLRDILKKLPGFEVDRAGNVSVQGKKVTKLLVENKQFFTGDSKLAVNNIPADAIDGVEVLDNFNEIAFLKDLEDSDEMAVNIKLKEDKKQFVFGDVKAGSDVKERYLINPKLFYYSPKTSINVIGDFNNTGKKSFTIKDYLEFEGGFNKLINDSKGYFSLLNDDFANFLESRDFISSINQFSALSINQSISSKTDLSGYGILSKTTNQTRSETLNDYINNENLLELRTTNGENKNRFGIGKLTFTINPNSDTNISIGSSIKASANNSQKEISSITQESQDNINTLTDAENILINQDFQWHRQFSDTHTTSAVLNYKYNKTTPNINWLTDKTIFPALIPLIEANNYDIVKNKKTNSNNLNLVLKHYWVLNRYNHIYFSLGGQFAFDDYLTKEYQQLEDGSINDFTSADFGNDTSVNFKDTFVGIHYKLKKGKIIFKPGLFYHYYNWSISQFESPLTNKKTLILPELVTNIEFSESKKLDFKYSLNARFPNISQLANRLTLVSFNNIFKGDESLQNELYHNIQLYFRSFALYKDLLYNVNINYRQKGDNIKNATIIQGIDFVSTPILSNFEDNQWRFSGYLRKGFGKYKFSINADLNLSQYEQPINTEVVFNSSTNYSYGAKMETRFKNFPNMELGYKQSISKYRANTTSKFKTDVFSTEIEYDFLRDFILNLDYRFENYRDETFNTSNIFDIANASLFYQKENSPWSFEVTANNIFDIEFNQQNSFSNILVADTKTFVLPRIVMLSLAYNL